MRSTTKIHSRAVRPIFKESLEYPRTLRTSSRSANEIKKVGKKWTESTKSSCYIIEYELDLFYLSF